MLHPGLVFVFVVGELAVYNYLLALAEGLLSRQACFAPDNTMVPLGFGNALALLVFVRFAGSQTKIRDALAVAKGAGFGVAAKVAYEENGVSYRAHNNDIEQMMQMTAADA